MNIKSHPEYWGIHKKIYQQEYDILPSSTRWQIAEFPHSREAQDFNKRVVKEVERKLLLSTE